MRCEKALFGAPWYALLGLILIPVLWPVGAWVEKQFFPVVRNFEIVQIQQGTNGLLINVEFDKVRSCEFVGVVWYNGPIRVGVERSPNSALYPNARSEGPQAAGPWLIRNVSTLDNTHAAVFHKCHPLWTTESHLYP